MRAHPTSYKICLVQTGNKLFTDTQMFGIYFMPVWAYTLSAHIEKIPNVEISLFDERMQSRSELPHANLYLFTGINQDAEAILDLNHYVREKFKESRICIGGPITWSYHTAGKLDQLNVFDHVFVGDGEETLPQFLELVLKGGRPERHISAKTRFDLSLSLPMSRKLIGETFQNYYGGVIEVSRGCPFLCEFCDIRILPDNNRSHIRSAQTIIDDLDYMAKLGIKQILFACDNFIGNLAWAEEVCDKIIEWNTRTGFKVSLYTWLTINISKNPRLMEKLRRAGFDMFFIGVESFYKSSLLETAKVQNTGLELQEALRKVQSYGFIVVAGLIFGFDSDPDDIADITLEGILKSGLISGDPSLLMALPGTPLYKRMQLSGRLRDSKFNLGGFKYQTNIKYLRHSEKIQNDFLHFIRVFTGGRFQLERLKSFCSCITDSPNYIPPMTAGFADIKRMLHMTVKNRRHIYSLVLRFARLLGSFDRSLHIARAFFFIFRNTSKNKPLWFYFKFWLFNWSNALVKYSDLSSKDFNVDWVGKEFDMQKVLPDNYQESNEQIPIGKTRNQRQITSDALKDLIKKAAKG